MKEALKRVLPVPLLGVLRKGSAFYRERKRETDRKARLRQYAGDNVECVFCRKRFSRFRPTGVLDRPYWKTPEARELLKLPFINVDNAMCPWCGASERHRALYFYLRDGPPGISGIREAAVLDIAPDGFLTNAFFRTGNPGYVSMDIAVSRRPSVIMSLTELGFAEASFDLVICFHVLEHIPDDAAAIREMHRVMKPGGRTIVQVPVWGRRTFENPRTPPDRRLEVYGHRDHVRVCGPDYTRRLSTVGFRVTEDEFIAGLPEDTIERFGLKENEVIWICKKE
ncbi:MAG: methyltransferase domain-containing protein [Proteobacteria bacterium]|nr:methyltransferase domain-containing protein [Pseudomonadota bacterium]